MLSCENTVLPLLLYAVNQSGMMKMIYGDADTNATNSTSSTDRAESSGIPAELETVPGKFGVLVVEMAILGVMGLNTMR